MDKGYSIRTASQLTGLSEHVIRAWERRYAAVSPPRTGGNQRKYSERDVARLKLLATAVAAGNTIGRIAGLTDHDLEGLVRSKPVAPNDDDPGLLAAAVDAVRRLDPAALEDAIVQASVMLGQTGAIETVIVPMMDEIGRGWHEGTMRIMHEHMATAVVRTFLGGALRGHHSSSSEYGVVVATPTGQSHELGALACAVLAASLGLRVTYLGASVPADEIIAATLETASAAVLISVVFPRSPTHVREELQILRRHLPRRVRLIVGGASASQVEREYAARTFADLRGELGILAASGE